MKKIIWALLVITIIGVILAVFFLSIKYLRPKISGLYVDSSPTASVVINGQKVGNTPYRNKSMEPGEITIRLEPQDGSKDLLPFDTKVNLAPNIETVLKREFGNTEEESSTELYSFEDIAKNDSQITIVTMPSNAALLIDNSIKGFSPYKSISLSPGDHSAVISLSGFVSKEVKFKTHEGYRLVVYLALKKENVVEVTPTPTPEITYIEILKTPTGFLRVRREPSTAAVEVAQVEPGNKYRLIEENQTGWFKIEYETGKFGWITNQFGIKSGQGSAATSSASLKKQPSPTPAF